MTHVLERADPLEVTWVDIATTLLRFCRRWQPDAADWALLGNQPSKIIGWTIPIMAGVLRAADGIELASDGPVPSTPSLDALKALCNRLRLEAQPGSETHQVMAAHGASPQMVAVALARAAAGSVDQVYGDKFLDIFRLRDSEVLIRDGDPYPVTPRNPAQWVGAFGLNSNPATLPSHDLASLPRLRLGTHESEQYEFRIDFTLWERLGRVGDPQLGRLRIAAGVPNLYLDEYDLHTPPGLGVYYNRGPADPEIQNKLIVDQIVTAGRAGAHILVLPEYSTDAETLTLVRKHLAALDEGPALVVAGAVESDEGANLIDRASMWILGPRDVPSFEVEIPPTFEVEIPPKVHAAQIAGLDEGILPGTQIQIFVDRKWTMAVLICRDAMSEVIVRQLADVGVNLVLVPSMTPRSATMLVALSHLTIYSQAFIAVANGPAHWAAGAGDNTSVRGKEDDGSERVEAAFLGPYRLPNATVLAPSGAGAQPPVPALPGQRARGTWVFETDSRGLRWNSTW